MPNSTHSRDLASFTIRCVDVSSVKKRKQQDLNLPLGGVQGQEDAGLARGWGCMADGQTDRGAWTFAGESVPPCPCLEGVGCPRRPGEPPGRAASDPAAL